MEIEKLSEKELILKAKEDKRYKLILLEKHYKNACKWTKKFLNRIVYSNLFSPSKEEIDSLVYIAFEKAIEKINPEKENRLSFKNYFYLMIKYQCYYELKNDLKCGVIKNFNEEKKLFELEQNKNFYIERDYINNISSAIKTEEIMKFLFKKNKTYMNIINMKMKGFKNSEICKTLNISPISLKSRIQYIRKLIREHFSDFSETF